MNDGSIKSQVLEQVEGIAKATGSALVNEAGKTAQATTNQLNPLGDTNEEILQSQTEDQKRIETIRKQLHQEISSPKPTAPQTQEEQGVSGQSQTLDTIQSSQTNLPPLPQNVRQGTRETVKTRE